MKMKQKCLKNSAQEAPQSKKMMLVMICIVLVLINLNFVNASGCYQEYANVSTSCGGKNTGLYEIYGLLSNINNVYDGNWDTSAERSINGWAQIIINYTKPINLTSTIWQVRFANKFNNYTLPESCVNWSDTQIRVYLYSHYPSDGSSIGCYKSASAYSPLDYSGAYELDSSTVNNDLYEEAMIWNISSYDSGEINIFRENFQTFNTITYETSSENFVINISYDNSNYSSISANLIYNGSSYEGTTSLESENTLVFSRTITIPLVPTQTNKTFYWSIGLINSSGTYYYNSTFNNQTINSIGLGLCGGALNIVAINFTSKNETSLVGITSFDFAGDFEIRIGVGNIFKSGSVINVTGVNSIALCTSQNTTYYINANIDYFKPGFSQRSYYLRNAQINNITNNITLYLLDSGLSTSIIINAKDQYLTNLKDHLIKVLRYYPGHGVYYLVETAKTDDFGNAIIKAQQENVDYKFLIENSTGNQIYSSNPMRIICVATPCTLEFITGETEHIVQQLIDFANVNYNLIWNNNTGYVTFDYSDSSGLTQTMRLLVTKTNAYGETTICDDTLSGTAGILTCYLGANATGEYSAKVYRTASPATYFAQLNISLTNIWQTFGTEGLVWMFMFIIVMFFAGLATGPASAAIMTLVGIVFMMATGIVYMPVVVVISVAVVVVLFIIKMRA